MTTNPTPSIAQAAFTDFELNELRAFVSPGIFDRIMALADGPRVAVSEGWMLVPKAWQPIMDEIERRADKMSGDSRFTVEIDADDMEGINATPTPSIAQAAGEPIDMALLSEQQAVFEKWWPEWRPLCPDHTAACIAFVAGMDAAPTPSASSVPVAWMRTYRQFSDTPIDPDPGYMVTSFHQNADYAAKYPDENVPLYTIPTVNAQAVCTICDGGPGNSCACTCGFKRFAAPPANPAPSVPNKRVRLPDLSEELYEHYPAMSAQAHEAAVKEYARALLQAK